MATKIILIITSLVIYILIWSVGCSPMAVYTHEAFQYIGINSEIALADVDDKNYCHAYLLIDNKPFEPRYFGLYLQNNINYNEPTEIYKSTDDFTNAGRPIIPKIRDIIIAIT